MNREELLDGLNNNQKEAVLHMDGACCVIANAGAGKTKVLTSRIANMILEGINPQNILAVTFTKKAGEEMKERLEKLIGSDASLVSIGTFHSICYHMIQNENRLPRGVKTIKDWQQQKFITEILEELEKQKSELKWDIKQCLSFINGQKNYMVTSNDELLIDYNIKWLKDDLEYLYKQYEIKKEKENLIDFSDMLLKCYIMLKEDENIRQFYQNKFKYIMVDEFQDTNKIQYEILKLLINKDENIFVVGDDKQSIYGFNYADVNIMLEFPKTWTNTKVIPLNINYRSTQDIVDLSNKLIKYNKNQFKIECRANQDYYKKPIFNCSFDEDEEAEYISNQIKELHKDYKYQDIAILYRCNAQSRAMEDSLIKHKIPYIILSGTNFLQRKEILDLTAYLKVIQNQSNNEAIKRIINIPNRYLGNVFINSIDTYAERNNISIYDSLVDSPVVLQKKYWERNAFDLWNLIKQLLEKNLSPAKLIRETISMTKYYEYLKKINGDDDISDRIENINSFIALAEKYDSIDGFLSHINKMIKDSQDNNSKFDKVKLMTIHKSKGLEFPIVFVIGVNEGRLPHARSLNVDEERRVAYVGVSRPQKELFVSWSMNDNNKPTEGSVFVENMIGKKEKEKLQQNYESKMEGMEK
jgi:Superfamily I DNA and RNA helicases